MAKRQCRYGTNCFRKNPEHLAQFCHPEDPEWNTADAAVSSNSHMYTNDEGEVVGMIEQGPALIRILAFGTGGASLFFALLRVINLLMIFSPVTCILNVYLCLFSLTTILFEAKPEWISMVTAASRYQDMLIQFCPFFTFALGRGLFYFFQGTLWMSLRDLNMFEGMIGLALGVVGVLHVLMHFGVMPEHIAEKAMSTAGVLRGGP